MLISKLRFNVNNSHCAHRTYRNTRSAVGAVILINVHEGLINCYAVCGTYCNTSATQHALVWFKFYHFVPKRKIPWVNKKVWCKAALDWLIVNM